MKYLTFVLEEESYAIGIEFVTEIMRIQTITRIPKLAAYIVGIINVRGNIIPVMDVRIRFEKAYKEYTDRTCIIVVEIKDVTVGLIVDSVTDVVTIPKSDIIPPPEIEKSGNRYINLIGKVGEDIKLILDCEQLLNGKEYESIVQIKEER